MSGSDLAIAILKQKFYLNMPLARSDPDVYAALFIPFDRSDPDVYSD
jgi:hypothetical protein